MEEPNRDELSVLPPPPPPVASEADGVSRPTGFEQAEVELLRDPACSPPSGLAEEDYNEEADLQQPDASGATTTGGSPVVASNAMDVPGQERDFLKSSLDHQCESKEVCAASGDLMGEDSSVPFYEENQLLPPYFGMEVEEVILPHHDANGTTGNLMPECSFNPSLCDGEDERAAITELNTEVLDTEQMNQSYEESQQLSPKAEDEEAEGEESSYQGFEQEVDYRDAGETMPQASPLASTSSSSEEDENAGLSEACTHEMTSIVQEIQKDDEDAGNMMLQASPLAFMSSSSEDEKAAVSENDMAGTVDMSGGYDATEEEGMELEAEEGLELEAEETELSGSVRRGGKRQKRGRPPKAQVLRTPRRRKDKDEEEVCFICFDGGDLVVCDRRGCPKVYHPSCVDRDEAFFRAKGRWNCGWHICSNCQKSSHYMCFTCTHSLCKGCFKETMFFCLRGNKGFCKTCMSTVMLMETRDENDRMVGVNFDDKNSFEYLFKDYWLDLKANMSLTLGELMRAKNMLKGSEQVTNHEETSEDGKEEVGAGSDNYSRHQDERSSSRNKGIKRSRNTLSKEIVLIEDQNAGTSANEETNWASDELLEFVAHMKDGDRSVLSQFDVQALLLEYIKRNNLRDPRKKSQIICDSRLENLFGKSRVGHFEMLKLLESHFLLKEASTLETESHQGGVEDPDLNQTCADGYSDTLGKLISDKRKKSRKRGYAREQANLDDYAAVDVHNISLMYLRRNLMEELITDSDTFHEKVIGSFVRIRISGAGQRQDVYRLVQVVDIGTASEKYKSGKKLTDVTLEILNLDKKEVITIDIISNQEFTEEECKRLRQSIKCGLIRSLKVGEVQEKAWLLQAVKVNDWMESEKLRLSHLRDRASEKGRRKELRECVEKLELLSTPDERRRRLNEVPEIHTDPHMDPEYESPEEEQPVSKRKDFRSRSRGDSFRRSEREVKSPGKGGSTSSDYWSSQGNSNTWESNRNMLVEGAHISENSGSRIGGELSSNQATDSHNAANSGASKDQVVLIGSQGSSWDNKHRAVQPGDPSAAPSVNQLTSVPEIVASSSKPNESEKNWQYQDPSGKIQGPFSIAQLRKWSTNGYFPSNLRIWRVSEKKDDSILLTDALVGNFLKDLPQWEPPISSSQQRNVLDIVNKGENMENFGAERNAAALTDKQNGEDWRLGRHEKWVTQPSALPSLSREISSSQQRNAQSGQTQHQDSPRPVTQANPNTLVTSSNHGGQGYDNLGPNLYPSGRGHLDLLDKSQTAPAQQVIYGWSANSSSDENHCSSAFSELKQIPGNMSVSNLPLRDEMNQQSNTTPFNSSVSVDKNSGWTGQQSSGVLSAEYNKAAPYAVIGSSGSPARVGYEGSTLQSAVVAADAQNFGDALGSDPAMRPEETARLISQPSNQATETISTGNILVHTQALPSTNSGWNNSADPTLSSTENVQFLPSGIYNPLASSHFLSNASILPGQPLPTTFNFAASAQNSNTSYNQGPNLSIMPSSQGMHGDQNTSWVAQGNSNASWGQTVQPNANANMSFPVPQVNMLMNPGWVAPPQGNTNMNMAWVTPPVNPNQLAGWGQQVQGNMALNPGWGMIANPFPCWPAGTANANQSWETTQQGNMNNNTGESGQSNANQTWAPSAENGKGWGNQQKGSGDRHPSHSSPGSHESRQSGWRLMPPGKSSQPSSVSRGGICRFHESGHCKKGASCNYFHQ